MSLLNELSSLQPEKYGQLAQGLVQSGRMDIHTLGPDTSGTLTPYGAKVEPDIIDQTVGAFAYGSADVGESLRSSSD
jgi:hypothetical protein